MESELTERSSLSVVAAVGMIIDAYPFCIKVFREYGPTATLLAGF